MWHSRPGCAEGSYQGAGFQPCRKASLYFAILSESDEAERLRTSRKIPGMRQASMPIQGVLTNHSLPPSRAALDPGSPHRAGFARAEVAVRRDLPLLLLSSRTSPLTTAYSGPSALPPLVALCRLSHPKPRLNLPPEKRTMKSLCSLLLAASLCLSTGCLSHPAFQGGRLHKSRAIFFSTIYLAEFQELDLNKDGQYSIVFRGFPASPVYLDLNLVGRTGRDREFLRRFTSEVAMELDKADGVSVCKAAGKLNQHQGIGDHFWVLASAVDEARFWNSDCSWLKIRRDQAYTLKITVRGSNPALGPLRAHPILWTPHD
jgi:hypothetical protein